MVSAEFSLSAIIAVVLVVLDKAGKLNFPVLLVMLALAALLAVHPTWVFLGVKKVRGKAKTLRAFTAISLVLVFFGPLGFWIWPKKTISSVASQTAIQAPNPTFLERKSEPLVPPPQLHQSVPQQETIKAMPSSAQSVIPQQLISAPNGIAIGGGVVTNPTVNNNYAPPPPPLPHLINLTRETSNFLEPDSPLRSHPAWELHFSVDRVFANPAFQIVCDHPCVVQRCVYPSGMLSFSTIESKNSNIHVCVMRSETPLLAGTPITATVISADDQPFNVQMITPYKIPPELGGS